MINTAYVNTPGTRFVRILTQVQTSLSLYQRLGMDGILSLPGVEDALCQRPTLESIDEQWRGCQRCKLHTSRTHLVFGAGNPQADLMFIGEGPGEQEDVQGEPFVGKAGDLLTRIIEALGLRRDDVYITNIVKCRPPHNRDPEPDEIEMCLPILQQQLEAIHPKIICALGRVAAQTLLQTTAPISKLRGRFYNYHGIQVMPTYHPAYLLRTPKDKRLVWEDLKLVRKAYEAGVE